MGASTTKDQAESNHPDPQNRETDPEGQFARITEQFLDLWQEQLTIWNSEGKSPEKMGELWQRFLHDKQWVEPMGGIASGLNPAGAFAAAAGTASYDPVILVPQLLARIATLEARLAALESRLNTPGATDTR